MLKDARRHSRYLQTVIKQSRGEQSGGEQSRREKEARVGKERIWILGIVELILCRTKTQEYSYQ
jgi:hypothetical protein